MFKAKCFYTLGWGLEVGVLKADTYAELMTKVDRVCDSFCVEKIVFSYPSGKTFTKIF